MSNAHGSERGDLPGTADRNATDPRRPGERAFALLLLAASLGLLWSATGIENPFGPDGLSAPRAVPVATTAIMALAAAFVLLGTLRRPREENGDVVAAILPRPVILLAGLLLAYGLLLRPLGFLPTSALFLAISIRALSGRSWAASIAITLACLIPVWVVFRLVFGVLMPAGIVPEAEMIGFLRSLARGSSGP